MMDAMEIDSQYEASTMRSQHLSSPTPPSEELRQTEGAGFLHVHWIFLLHAYICVNVCLLYEYVNSLFSTLSQRHAQRASSREAE